MLYLLTLIYTDLRLMAHEVSLLVCFGKLIESLHGVSKLPQVVFVHPRCIERLISGALVLHL